MKRVFFGCLVLGLTAAGCAKDPTGDLSGSAASVVVSYSLVNLVAGDSILVTAETRDGQDVVLPEVPVPTSANSAVASVSNAYLPPLSQARFYIKGVAAGSTSVTVAAPSGGASAEVDVVVD